MLMTIIFYIVHAIKPHSWASVRRISKGHTKQEIVHILILNPR